MQRQGLRQAIQRDERDDLRQPQAPDPDYLLAIAIFANGVKGHSALQLSRDLDCQYKTAFVLAHKLREAMGSEVHNPDQPELSGTVEVDGMYAGGNIKPENRKADRKDRRLAEEQTGKRQVVVVAREVWAAPCHSSWRARATQYPSYANTSPRARIIHADESNAWERLHASYDTRRVNHSQEYVTDDGTNVNQAESFFSRLRRAEYGVHHRISGQYLYHSCPLHPPGPSSPPRSISHNMLYLIR
jgi:ISXO2-like transposase domain